MTVCPHFFLCDVQVRDYSGTYTVKMVPCIASPNEKFSIPPVCSPRETLTFEMDIRFQQVRTGDISQTWALKTCLGCIPASQPSISPPETSKYINEIHVSSFFPFSPNLLSTPFCTFYLLQVSDPVAAEFSLNTQMFLLSKKELWLSDGSMGFGEGSDTAFSEGVQILPSNGRLQALHPSHI